ncbi:hypothetical protein DL546_003074 [Coniochaeta pulveracea]|uniref:Uncharacterized protein n=1 Tax=Coniochaeta pulveracea TaxID=177199 RepID=A0A420XZ39_9PEZI|nr:hypothetical protein DL546_003074 [Coniochaeta pulveracea]
MKRKSLSGHENTCVYAAIAKLSSEVAHLKEARRNDKVVIDLLLEGREHDQAEIKQIKDTLALMPGVRDENDHKTPEFLQRQIEEETIGALDTMASRMAAMDSALEIVVPTLETVVHKHELYAMHSDLLNRLRQAMRLNHVVRDQGAMGTNSSSSKETQPSTAGDTAAARPRLQQQRRREDEDRYVPASRRAQNTTSTGTRPPSSRVLQPETARASIYEANRRRRSTDGLRNGAPKL